MSVYHLCLVSNDEISIDEANNAYYLLTDCRSARMAGAHPAPQPIYINVPANFVYPQTKDPSVNFVPAATGSHQLASPYPQVIPVENVVKPADMSGFVTVPASAKDSSRLTAGVYIGPVHTDKFSYLQPCTYTPFVGFNAMILRTCKTIYAEALPILYGKNRLVLHSQFGYKHFFNRFAGPILTCLINLRLEVIHFNRMLDEGGSNSLWSTIIRECKLLRSLRLTFSDSYYCLFDAYVKAVIRVAANIADVKKGTGEPRMMMRVILEDLTPSMGFFAPGNLDSEVQDTMAKKTHQKMQLPRGPTVELVGKMSKDELLLVRRYKRKGWCFKKKSLQKDSELAPGFWVEMEWVKS